MYRPKFCAECGARIIRLRWRLWTSRKFCDRCAPRFIKQHVSHASITCTVIFLAGMAVGEAAHRTPPAVIVQRSGTAASPSPIGKRNELARSSDGAEAMGLGNGSGVTSTEEIYMCGARTRKGTPCTRRVHGPVRCWQHLGKRAMLPQEELRIKAQ